ncbi:MAG: IS200/IS605 family transposase [Bacteroidota bacterium]|jgi:putative transposase
MANTYTQLYIHVVFAVKRRACVISKSWRDELFQYITGIITNKGQKLMIVNGVEDHIHILLGIKPDCNLSDLVRDIKANSSRWINEKKLVQGKFEWQNGFGAFSVGASQVNIICNYIAHQEEHHQTTKFRKEYIEFLQAYDIDYKEEYLFEEIGGAPTELDQ